MPETIEVQIEPDSSNLTRDQWAARVVGIHDTVIFHSDDSSLDKNTYVVIQSKYGLDLAILLGKLPIQAKDHFEPCQYVRKANDSDLSTYALLQEQGKEAEMLFRKKIDEHRLPMKPVCAHYLLDQDKLLFFFTADSRVDFRDLVKDLVGLFHTRIELRQIGVRDESRIIGGRGVCGRCLCCNSLSENLQPVSIKMAKTQNLSLNSVKISGPCGRLLCCLAYEQEAYLQELDLLPNEGEWITVEDVPCRIVEVNPISKAITLVNRDGFRKSIKPCELEKNPVTKKWEYQACPSR